ncbi:MAG: glycosyltransferase family 39 protein [Planctomycetes bacterium]|nr:glycosyltransferase family 39 protein [Planctomycetota bacterium]
MPVDGEIKNQKSEIKNAPRAAWLWLGACLAVGLAARLGAVALPHVAGSLTVSGRPISEWAKRPLFPDTDEYTRMAANIRQGQGMMLDRASRIGRMPGYPVFLAVVQALFGEQLLAARVADALVGAAAIALVWLLAREVYGRAAAAIAAAITALYPFFVVMPLLVLSETLFAFFLVLGAWLLAKAYRSVDIKWSAAAGLAFGLATLTRGSFLAVAPLTAAAWVALSRLDRRAAACAGALVGAFALSMAPWVARNWAASDGHLVLTTLRVGPSLYEGLNPHADGGPMMDRINWSFGTEGLSEHEQHRHWQRAALRYASEHPGRALALAAIKLGRFWNVVPNLEQFRGTLPCLALGVPYSLVMLLAIVGFAREWRRADAALILLLPVVYHCLVHMAFVGSVRYREVLMPLLVAIAAHGLNTLWSWARGGRAGTDRDRAGVQRGGDGDSPPGAGGGGAVEQAGGGCG